jgi:hypothetical protein
MQEDLKARLLQEAAVMQAYANGEEVQYQYPYSREWITFYGEYFNFAEFDYRIKPVVKKSVGYRKYLCVQPNEEGVHKDYVSTYREDNVYLSEKHIENIKGFIRWIDTEWQYEIV